MRTFHTNRITTIYVKSQFWGSKKNMLFQKELLIKKFNFGASGDPTPVLDEAQSKKWNAMVLELFLYYVFFAIAMLRTHRFGSIFSSKPRTPRPRLWKLVWKSSSEGPAVAMLAPFSNRCCAHFPHKPNNNPLCEISILGIKKNMLFQKELLIKKFNKWNAMKRLQSFFSN